MNDIIYSQLRFRFFRDLSAEQRLKLMHKMGMLPDGYDTTLTHCNEDTMLKYLKETGRLDELREEINAILY